MLSNPGFGVQLLLWLCYSDARQVFALPNSPKQCEGSLTLETFERSETASHLQAMVWQVEDLPRIRWQSHEEVSRLLERSKPQPETCSASE